MGFAYPSAEEIIDYNVLALTLIKAKKSDAAKVLSRQKINDALEACEKAEGGIREKAAVLLKSLVCAHAFASGNRRTAFLAAKDFVSTKFANKLCAPWNYRNSKLIKNGGEFRIPDDPSSAFVLRGIREGFYSLDEIKEWIEHGKIREFGRGR